LSEEDRSSGFPTWLAYIDSMLPATSLFVVHGNIRDLHLIPSDDGDGVQPMRSRSAIRTMLAKSGLSTVLYYSALHGLMAVQGSDDAVAKSVLGSHASDLGKTPSLEILADIAWQVSESSDQPVALIVDYLSQSSNDQADLDSKALYLRLLRIANEGVAHLHANSPRRLLRNPIFLLVDHPGDLPAWLLSGDGIRQVPVPVPDLPERKRAIAALLPLIYQGSAEPEDQAREVFIDRFTDATNGLTLRALNEIVQVRADAEISPDHIEDAARRYRVGVVKDVWREPDLVGRVRTGQARLEDQIKGQERAIRHSLDILIRSVTGMTAAHRRERGGGPRGVMFFAGPTGVGKTELTKAITKLLFGDESAFIRFDMSEFAQEQSEARLIGSPPGYVNHDQGGELTNAVRAKPFSVLLFDEFEKAHPRIFDKFLQILSDGRLTDGSGDTVFFSEALIVFTSNLGVGTEGTSEEDARNNHGAFEASVLRNVREAFTDGLKRPELLGRIGDNIVVFDYITPDIAREIADGYVTNVLDRVAREEGVTLTLPDDIRSKVLERSITDLSLGARGVGNFLETTFVNPLARAIFGIERGSSHNVSGVDVDAHGVVTVVLS
jgi:ATP-dependent Clp protease ATP-binding subunit ClpB